MVSRQNIESRVNRLAIPVREAGRWSLLKGGLAQHVVEGRPMKTDYRCAECRMVLPTQEDYIRHVETFHQPEVKEAVPSVREDSEHRMVEDFVIRAEKGQNLDDALDVLGKTQAWMVEALSRYPALISRLDGARPNWRSYLEVKVQPELPASIPTGRKVCSVEGCDNLSLARGLCSSHYWRWYYENVKKPKMADGGKDTVSVAARKIPNRTVVPVSEREDRVLALLQSSPNGVSREDVDAALGTDKNVSRLTLARLASAGKIRKEGDTGSHLIRYYLNTTPTKNNSNNRPFWRTTPKGAPKPVNSAPIETTPTNMELTLNGWTVQVTISRYPADKQTEKDALMGEIFQAVTRTVI